jgi:hypothetical protein
MTNTTNNFKLNNGSYTVFGDPTGLITAGWGGNGTETK